MDAATEHAIIQSLNAATRGITTVFVTHRGPILEMADRIVIVDGGRVVADGPRDEILQRLSARGGSNQEARKETSNGSNKGPSHA